MASLIVLTEPATEIDYSLVDGRVRSFVLRGMELYDEKNGTESEDWKTKLVEFVRQNDLGIDHDGHGLHAFVHWMNDQGLIKNQ